MIQAEQRERELDNECTGPCICHLALCFCHSQGDQPFARLMAECIFFLKHLRQSDRPNANSHREERPRRTLGIGASPAACSVPSAACAYIAENRSGTSNVVVLEPCYFIEPALETDMAAIGRAQKHTNISGFRSAVAIRVEIERCIASQQKFVVASRDKPQLVNEQEKVLLLLREALEANEVVVRLCDALSAQRTRFAEPTNSLMFGDRKRVKPKAGK